MNEKDWQAFLSETDSVKQAMLLAKVTNDASEKADQQNRRLWLALAGSIIGNVILVIVMVCSVIYMQAHAQEMLNKGLENALQAYQDGTAIGAPQSVAIATADDLASVTVPIGPRVACKASSIISLVATTTAGNVVISGVDTLAWKL